VIRTTDRDRLRAFLKEKGIGTEIYYPTPLHLQPCYRDLGYKIGAFPHAEQAAHETLALPIYAELTEDQQAYVVASIKKFYSSR
jgi:dTDP-4-amino-4,6-dideoxygalactose transaminase